MSEEQKTKVRRFSRVIEGLTIGFIIFTCGGFTGYWIASNEAKIERLELRKQHQAELERTTKAYSESLSYLTGKVLQAGATVDNAAQAAETAATAAQKAAATADKAVKQSASALNKADKLPEPTREQINRAVQRANRNTGQ